jgi:hypothetical protein
MTRLSSSASVNVQHAKIVDITDTYVTAESLRNGERLMVPFTGSATLALGDQPAAARVIFGCGDSAPQSRSDGRPVCQ